MELSRLNLSFFLKIRVEPAQPTRGETRTGGFQQGPEGRIWPDDF